MRAQADQLPAPPAQASSLEFLSGCGFDFNKCIREGVPYMTGGQPAVRLRWTGGSGPFRVEAWGTCVAPLTSTFAARPHLNLRCPTLHTAVARDARLARIVRDSGAEERAAQRPPIQLTARRDIEFKEDFVARVREWLAVRRLELMGTGRGLDLHAGVGWRGSL